MSRLALTDADKEARDWFVTTAKELDCKVYVDAMGNTFAIRKGRRSGPPTYAGSHLDTQPSGGRYDGILGVHAGVEMLRVFKEHKIETEYPVGVINWTNEEGARFPKSMVSSGVWSGDIPLEEAHSLVEVGDGNRTMKQELDRIGYLGDIAASYKAMPIGAHFELHIEQGPRLENESLKIGVVQGVQAYKWFNCHVTGRDCHTGTTPFEARQDAMLCAAKLIVQSNISAIRFNSLASTGILTVSPGSVNTVPGEVWFTLDVRSATNEQLAETLDDFDIAARHVLAECNGCKFTREVSFPSGAIKFHEECIECVRNSAEQLFPGSHRPLISGAGHDSVFASKRAPTTMIFVPCRKGVSHHPEEYCSPEDCANGSQVLMDAIQRYDRLRASRA